MSHFTVLVVGDDIASQLAPFQENNMDDCPKEYLEFHDRTEECVSGYETDETERGGVKVSVKEVYTFEDYVEEWYGYEKDEEIGKYGYWENPNKKWDWYEIGGRWAGHLIIKSEFWELYSKQTPNFSWGWDEESKRGVIEQRRVDSAIKKHIDFDGMMNEAGEEAREEYRQVTAYLSKYPEFQPWKYYLDKLDNNEISIEEARTLYNDQPAKKNLFTSTDELGKNAVWIELDKFVGISEEKYVENARIQSIMTFAILKDGEWIERGKMGWWACVSDEKGQEEWEQQYKKIIDSIDDDAMLTIVDCHI